MAGLGSAVQRGAMTSGNVGGMPEGAAPAGAPMPQAPDLGGMENASPEEQDSYDRFVARSLEFIYDQKTLEKVVGMLSGGGDDPVSALAVTAAMIVARVEDAAEAAGQKVSGDVLIHAGKEVFEDLAELATRARIHDFGADQDGFEAAWYRALDEYRVMRQSQGKLDQGVFQQDLAGLQQADQDGRLATMMQSLGTAGAEEEPAATGGTGLGAAVRGGKPAEGADHEMALGDAEEDAAEGEPEDTRAQRTGAASDFPDEEDEPAPRRPARR